MTKTINQLQEQAKVSGSVYFKAPMVHKAMTVRELLALGRDLPKGTRCLAEYQIKMDIFVGKAVVGWNAGSEETTLMISGLPDKTVFIIDDKLDQRLSHVIGSIVYLNL